MRRPIVAGNWKMNTTLAEAVSLLMAIRAEIDSIGSIDRVVCPPFISLAAAAEVLADSEIQVGAQNMHVEVQGAFTGEISPLMLQGLASHVILGHSERREYFSESDELISRKAAVAEAHGLTPIVCVGENLAQNQAGATEAMVGGQVRAVLSAVRAPEAIVLAYEPLWAIGSGQAASAEQVNGIARMIRGVVAESVGDAAAAALRIQYGGSVTPDNIESFMREPEVDGVLVGGASLKAPLFAEICRRAAEVASNRRGTR